MALPKLKFAPEAARALTDSGVSEIRQRVSSCGHCPRCKLPFAGQDVAASVRVDADRALALAYHAGCRPAGVIESGAPLADPDDLFTSTTRTALLPTTYLDERGAGNWKMPWVVIHPSHELTMLSMQPGGRWRSCDLDGFEADGFVRGPDLPEIGAKSDDTSCELFMGSIIIRGPRHHAWSAECTESYADAVRNLGGVVACVSTGWDPAVSPTEEETTTWFEMSDMVMAWYPLLDEPDWDIHRLLD